MDLQAQEEQPPRLLFCEYRVGDRCRNSQPAGASYDVTTNCVGSAGLYLIFTQSPLRGMAIFETTVSPVVRRARRSR